MRLLKALFFLLLFAACNAPRVVYDYDQQVNFKQYSTYKLFPDFQTNLSQLDEDRLVRALQETLQKRGFSEVSSPQLYINIATEQFQEQSRNSLGVGIGGTGRNVGVGVSGGIPLGGPKTFLKLTFDFIDVEEDALVWQAVVEAKFDPDASPEERQERFQKIVKKALEGYPPED
ncbi:DUF4136 domain-containing protein [Salinimicrobium sp. GXAS 041]|uniref:DUF4136 domain-containing protein n=1 Tax=Salinimicrobium sp. GXAS 041 TaxID=3400806 RepID=UPI003C7472AA